ncbi:MAG: acyl carrier protein [Reyranella sp.]|nr:acyl carrier protein [Reyranella sp.]
MNGPDPIDRLRKILESVAPDLDVSTIGVDEDLRNDIGLDSMDFLNFMIGISKQLGVAIPEADYGKVTTLAKCVRYIEEQGRIKRAPA